VPSPETPRINIGEFQKPHDHRVWEVADIVKLVEAAEAKPAKLGPYRKRKAA
jgi:hypothetical protein